MLNEKQLRLVIGERIREKRLEKGWSQAELAEKLSVSNRHVSRIETAQVGISLQMLVKLSNTFNTTPGWFFGEGSGKKSEELFNLLNQKDQETINVLMKKLLEDSEK